VLVVALATLNAAIIASNHQINKYPRRRRHHLLLLHHDHDHHHTITTTTITTTITTTTTTSIITHVNDGFLSSLFVLHFVPHYCVACPSSHDGTHLLPLMSGRGHSFHKRQIVLVFPKFLS
jgi:hypothetical protein